MKGALVLVVAGALSACQVIELKNYPRPFACDHNGGDGGKQCEVGWSCGFDDRCFDHVLDGGQLVTQWRCLPDAGHCPPDWKCSQEVDSIRNCQQLGVGAPTRCLDDDGGCEGGWRCASIHRCFDPSIVDGGTSRDCKRDGECPNGFRCGDEVDREQKCIQLGVGAPSLCNDDRGCEGTWRCDAFEHRCREITDVLTSGKTSTLAVSGLNPRFTEPAPLMMAMTRLCHMAGGLIGVIPGPDTSGQLMASLFLDGGLRVTVQLKQDQRLEDGGVARLLFEKTYGLPSAVTDLATVTDLAASSQGPAIRVQGGGAWRLWVNDGGWEPLGPTDFLRQRDAFDEGDETLLVGVSGRRVWVGSPDAGTAVSFDGGVMEIVADRDQLFAVTEYGLYLGFMDGGMQRPSQGVGLPLTLPAQSRGAIAGLLAGPSMAFPGFVAEVPAGGGGSAIIGFYAGPLGWTQTAPGPPCPDGVPLAMAFDDDGAQRPLVRSQCLHADGGTYPAQVLLNRTPFEYGPVVEDQVPWQWGVVSQRAGPFVRGHAGANGRIWSALAPPPPSDRSLLARAPLRPMILDRQPDTMLSFYNSDSRSIRVFAESGGLIFSDDPEGGLVSQLNDSRVTPLAFITSTTLIVTTDGLYDASIGKPRQTATMPPGARFSPPVTGVAVDLQLGGSLRRVVLVSSADTIWVADVTDALAGTFAQPAVFEPVLVPVPGVRLRSMTLEPSRGGADISGFVTTSTANLRFATSDLVRWQLTPVSTPSVVKALPLEVWAEPDGGAGRTGFSDGRVWSLPIMVQLTEALPLPDGGVAVDGGSLTATDFGRKCGDVFVATSAGVFRAEASITDGGLPRWVALPNVNAALGTRQSLRLYETHDVVDRLFVGTVTGQVVELTGACLP